MPYTARKPDLAPSSEELRRKIPGWGVDLDRSRRPAVPKENFIGQETGAHWEFPERQQERYPREKSTEHKFVTPVFGTSCPPKGFSGVMRRYAYTFSEGRLAHWLLLVAADRVDVVESRVQALLSGRPDNVILETGVLTELEHHGLRERLSNKRADTKHVGVDLPKFAASGVVSSAIGVALNRFRGNGKDKARQEGTRSA